MDFGVAGSSMRRGKGKMFVLKLHVAFPVWYAFHFRTCEPRALRGMKNRFRKLFVSNTSNDITNQYSNVILLSFTLSRSPFLFLNSLQMNLVLLDWFSFYRHLCIDYRVFRLYSLTAELHKSRGSFIDSVTSKFTVSWEIFLITYDFSMSITITRNVKNFLRWHQFYTSHSPCNSFACSADRPLYSLALLLSMPMTQKRTFGSDIRYMHRVLDFLTRSAPI